MLYVHDVPIHFHPLDYDVHDSGAPSSSWLGRECGRNSRWLFSRLRRGFCEAWAWGQADYPLPTIVNPGGVVLGPWTHYGTSGCSFAGGDFFLRAHIATGEICYLTTFSDSGIEQHYTMVGDHSVKNYGPFHVGIVDGPNKVGLLLEPRITGSVKGTEGSVEYAYQQTLRSTAADFGALTAPYPIIRIKDGSTAVTPWYQIIAVPDASTVMVDGQITDIFGPPYLDSDPEGWIWEYLDTPAGVGLVSVMFKEDWA